MISLRIVQEYNNSLSYHTKNGKEKYSSHLENNASKENVILREDKLAKIAKQPSTPCVNPSSEALTSLSCLLPEAIPLRGRWEEPPQPFGYRYRPRKRRGQWLLSGVRMNFTKTDCSKKHSEDITKIYGLFRAPDIS